MEMKYILEIFDIFEAYCLCRFILFHCPYKDGKRHFVRTFLWGVAVVLSVASLNILTYGANVPYGMLLCLFVTVIFAHINLKHSLRYKIIICSMIPVIFMLLDSTVAIIFVMVTKSDNSWNAIFEPGNRIMLAIIAKFVDMVVLEIYYMLCKQRTEKNDIGISVVLFAVVGFGVSCIIIHIMMSQSSSSFLFITIMYSVIMLAIYYAMFFMMYRIRMDNEEQIKYRMVIEEQELIRQHYAESKDIYIQLKIKRHDYKHHIAYMEYLFREKQFDKLESYIRQIQEGNNIEYSSH